MGCAPFSSGILCGFPADFGLWSSFKEVEMRKHVLVLTTTAAILTCVRNGAGVKSMKNTALLYVFN
jgi:hypothetical protein